MLTSAQEQRQQLSSAVVNYNNMLPFPQPRWRYCYSTLSKLHSVVDEVTHLLEYICTHDEYITSHIQELWVEMRMLQLKEHSAIALVNTSIAEVQRPFKAYWAYRKYIEVSNEDNSSSSNNNMTQKVSSLYSAYTHFVEEHEQLSSIFSKHDELIGVFVNNLHNQHQEETVFTQNEKNNEPEEIEFVNTNSKESCSNESVKINNDPNVNAEVLMLSCQDVQASISRVARALIALCEPNLLSSSSSMAFALLPKANNSQTSINSNLLSDINNTNVCKYSVNTKENENKEVNDSFYDSEHRYKDNIWKADCNDNTDTTNPATISTTTFFTENSKIKKLHEEDDCPIIINNKNRPMSNTDVHMSSFESNDSNTTHDTIPHTLCKTQNNYSNRRTNSNIRNTTTNNNNNNNESDKDKLHMPSTWQSNEMSKYSLRHIQEILEKGLHCIQVQLSELTQTQQEMMNKIDTFVKNMLWNNNKNSDTRMETDTTITEAGMNPNGTASTNVEAKHRAEIHALQATLFAWQESTKRLSHTLELTQTALRDEQIRSAKVEEENKSLQCRIDELIASRRRHVASPEEAKQANMYRHATQNTNIKNDNHYMYDNTDVNYHHNNYNNSNNNNLESTPIAQASSTTLVGRTPIAQIRAGIQRRLEEVAELANSLERVKISEEQEKEEEHHEEQQRQNETLYDQQRYYVTKHVQDKGASGDSVSGNRNCTNSTSAMKNNLQRSASKSVSEVDVSISPLSQDDSIMCDDKTYNNDTDVDSDDDGCDVIDISECNEDLTDKMKTNHNIRKDDKRETLLTITPQPSVKRHYDMNDAESVLQNAKRLLARLHNKGE